MLLIARVEYLRVRHKVGFKDGDVPALARAIRAQENANEHIPLTLILLILAESLGASGNALHLAGGSLVLSRILHGWGLNITANNTWQRSLGISLNWLLIISLAAYLGWKIIIAHA